jgi:hypothetical protein
MERGMCFEDWTTAGRPCQLLEALGEDLKWLRGRKLPEDAAEECAARADMLDALLNLIGATLGHYTLRSSQSEKRLFDAAEAYLDEAEREGGRDAPDSTTMDNLVKRVAKLVVDVADERRELKLLTDDVRRLEGRLSEEPASWTILKS